jgi:hypothetical protein
MFADQYHIIALEQNALYHLDENLRIKEGKNLK